MMTAGYVTGEKKLTAESKLVEEHLVAHCSTGFHNQHQVKSNNQQLVLFPLMLNHTNHILTHPTFVTMVGHGIIVFKDAIALTVSEVRVLL